MCNAEKPIKATAIKPGRVIGQVAHIFPAGNDDVTYIHFAADVLIIVIMLSAHYNP